MSDCGTLDVGCHLVLGALNGIASAFAGAGNALLQAIGEMWLKVPSPSILPGTDTGNAVGRIQTILLPILGFLLIVSVVIVGIMLMVNRRGEPLIELVKALLLAATINAGGLIILSTVIKAGDALADYILENQAPLKIITTNIDTPMQAALICILSLVLCLVSLIQIVVVIAKNSILLLAASIWTLSSGLYVLKTGKNWFIKTTSLILGAALYRPAAAIIYALAAAISNPDTQDKTMGTITNIAMSTTLMILAIFALPALIKIITPGVNAGAGLGAAGGIIGGAVAAGAMIALPHVAAATKGASVAAGAATKGAASAGGAAAGGVINNLGQSAAINTIAKNVTSPAAGAGALTDPYRTPPPTNNTSNTASTINAANASNASNAGSAGNAGSGPSGAVGMGTQMLPYLSQMPTQVANQISETETGA